MVSVSARPVTLPTKVDSIMAAAVSTTILDMMPCLGTANECVSGSAVVNELHHQGRSRKAAPPI